MKKFTLNIAPAIAGVAITVSYIPQLYTTFNTRNVSGQSLLFWLLLDVALLGLFIQQLGIAKYSTETKGNLTGILVQGVNLFCALAMTIMVILFR